MRELFSLVTAAPAGRIFDRPSVRAIILRGGRVAMVRSRKYDYYKFPGGGIEAGESHAEALARETREEAGLLIRPETVRAYGVVPRAEREPANAGFSGEYDFFTQDNFYYFCEVEPETAAQELDDYEADERFTLEWVAPEAAIAANRRPDHGPKSPVMIEREARVLELLRAEGYFSRPSAAKAAMSSGTADERTAR